MGRDPRLQQRDYEDISGGYRAAGQHTQGRDDAYFRQAFCPLPVHPQPSSAAYTARVTGEALCDVPDS